MPTLAPTSGEASNQKCIPAPFILRPRPRMGMGANLIGAEEEELVLDVLRRQALFRYYSNNAEDGPPPMAATLEREFGEMVGTKYALAVSSGTAALETTLGTLGVGPGDEVIVPAWSWISCFTAIVRVGALPVLAEIDETFSLAPGEIKRLSTPHTKAVIILHYQGVAADMEPLLTEAKECGVKVVEDCAQSAGATYHDQRVGSMGDIGIFSFQQNKIMCSGEGGLIVTDDAMLFERAVRMHDLGQVRSYHEEFITPQVPSFCGGQYRITELQAAVALAQLRKLDGILQHCRNLQSRVLQKIESLPEITPRRIPDPEGDCGFELYLNLPDREKATALTQRLNEMNVNCGKVTGTYCQYDREYCRLRQAHAPLASPFKHFEEWPAPGYRAEDFPRTEGVIKSFVALPLGVLYTQDDADYIGDCIRQVYEESTL